MGVVFGAQHKDADKTKTKPTVHMAHKGHKMAKHGHKHHRKHRKHHAKHHRHHKHAGMKMKAGKEKGEKAEGKGK